MTFTHKAMGTSLQFFNEPVLGLVKTDKIDSKVRGYYADSIARFTQFFKRALL